MYKCKISFWKCLELNEDDLKGKGENGGKLECVAEQDKKNINRWHLNAFTLKLMVNKNIN